MLYVADIAGAMPCTQNLSEKNVILFIYQIISQCSWQIFATACKEQSVKVSTVSRNSPFLGQKHLVGEVWVFFPLLLTEFLVWLSGTFSVHFSPDEQIVYSTHCLQLVLSGRAAAGPSPRVSAHSSVLHWLSGTNERQQGIYGQTVP